MKLDIHLADFAGKSPFKRILVCFLVSAITEVIPGVGHIVSVTEFMGDYTLLGTLGQSTQTRRREFDSSFRLIWLYHGYTCQNGSTAEHRRFVRDFPKDRLGEVSCCAVKP